MEAHTCLWNEVDALDFRRGDFDELLQAIPSLDLHFHESTEKFLRQFGDATYILAWNFQSDWYRQCPNLKLVLTPAAGSDWTEPDPIGRVELIHGSFHGPLLAESLLQAILFMNQQMPRMINNFRNRRWNRNIQASSRPLSEQIVLIIAFGNIGSYCAEKISGLGPRVIGIKKP